MLPRQAAAIVARHAGPVPAKLPRRRQPAKLMDRCFNCHSYNHMVADCKLPTRRLRCHGFWHLARNCKRPQLVKDGRGDRRFVRTRIAPPLITVPELLRRSFTSWRAMVLPGMHVPWVSHSSRLLGLVTSDKGVRRLMIHMRHCNGTTGNLRR